MALDLGRTTRQLLSALDGVARDIHNRRQRLDDAIDRALTIPADEAGAVLLMLCEQSDADCNQLCSAHHSPLETSDAVAGFDDRELFELLLEPSHRSPLYRSSHLAARFALGLATGQEWSHLYYLNGGAEIARVEVPDWLADDPELLALSHTIGSGLSGGHLRGPQAGRHQRPRPGGAPPPDPHAPGTARPAHSRVRQGVFQA